MNKADIFNLANAGIGNITNLTLDGKHAYKVLKFRRAIIGAYTSLLDEIKAITKEAGIEDPQAFDKERAELRAITPRTPDEDKRLAEMDKTFDRYKELEKELLSEEVKLDCVPMPYEAFHALQKENEKTFPGLAHGYIEDALENVLWVAPED